LFGQLSNLSQQVAEVVDLGEGQIVFHFSVFQLPCVLQ
jgi:hypothetical protein